MEMLDYEKQSIKYLKDNASECCLFLKKNDKFPLDKPGDICLVGNGIRHTIKGGTGSGDVVSRHFKNIEAAFIESGFNVVSTDWLDKYDLFKQSTKKEYIKECKKDAKKAHIYSFIYSMGYFEQEKDYDFDLDYKADACIYVLSRNSGEGNDRRNIKGDVLLSDSEIKDILYLDNKFDKFMLVLNVGGVVDLSPVKDVSNILLLSQLGVVTSDVLVDIVLGKTNPTGKLTTTWAKIENYPFFNEFGNQDNTYYKEGIYVGYRYFNSLDIPVLFPFGYGLSYSNFDIKVLDVKQDNMKINIECLVKNISSFPGKEVIQLYVSKPCDILDNPYVELCGYHKTKLLSKDEQETFNIEVDFNSLYNYDPTRAINLLQKGTYVLKIGNSSTNLVNVCKCLLEDEVILEKLENKCKNDDFVDFKANRKEENLGDLKEFVLKPNNKTRVVSYKKDEYVDPFIETLSNEQLAYLCLGNYESGLASIVGASCKHVVGGAGETTLKVDKIDKSLTMSDGPAGIRILAEYGIDKKGVYPTSLDPIMEKMIDFLPKIAIPFIKPPKNRHGTIYHQHTTAIPIGTAIAQSFNDDFAFDLASIVAKEMKKFNVDLWLAPALNIHRNILCGRNFEYYSEDPFLSGKMASNMTKGVQQNEKIGVTIKHFACNNQEFNRNNNNNVLSERTLREIYLKGFEICIKESNPKAIMTSYNLINGIHSSESYELVNDILRCEWNYQGLVMTDWIASGRSFCKRSYYPAPYASNNILAGNDLTMPGCKKD